ncbi:MAG TPA: DUF4412 domain-containing protein [Gemmatimonadales bacterium]
MRRAVLVSTVTLGLAWSGLGPSAAAAQRFQGMIRFTVHEESGRTMEITQYAKPGKSSFMAVEAGKPGGGMIVDSTAGTLTMIDGEHKTYTVINLVAMQQMMQGMAGMARGMRGTQRGTTDAEGAPKGTITATGRTEVVAGVTCQVYTYEGTDNGKHETGEVCLAKGAGLMAGGDVMGQMPGMMGMQRQTMQQRLQAWGPLGTLLAQGYGILKGTNYEDGKPKGSLEVTAFQRGAPPDAAFHAPPGFTEKSVGDMMGGGRRP